MAPRKKRSLGAYVRETWLKRKYRAARHDPSLDYEWSAIPYTRAAVVNLLLADHPDGRYLEIGCAGDELFAAVMATRKTGVDPMRGGTHRQTSDAFFASHPDERFDVVFIDGLHHYDQVRRDLVNSLGALAPGGWIAIHDMLPRDWLDEHVPQISTSSWTGDGWKVAFELLESANIDFRLLALDHGVAVIKPGQGDATLADLRADLEAERFAYLHRNFERLPVVDFAQGREWIVSHRVSQSGQRARPPFGVE